MCRARHLDLSEHCLCLTWICFPLCVCDTARCSNGRKPPWGTWLMLWLPNIKVLASSHVCPLLPSFLTQKVTLKKRRVENSSGIILVFFSITSMTNWQSDFISSDTWLWNIPFSSWWLFYINTYDLGRNIFSSLFFVFCLLRFCGLIYAASFCNFHRSL